MHNTTINFDDNHLVRGTQYSDDIFIKVTSGMISKYSLVIETIILSHIGLFLCTLNFYESI